MSSHEKLRLGSVVEQPESSHGDIPREQVEDFSSHKKVDAQESEVSSPPSLKKYLESYFPDRLIKPSSEFDPAGALEGLQLKEEEKEGFLARYFGKNVKEAFEKTLEYYKKNGRRIVTIAFGIALSKIALDYQFLWDKKKTEKTSAKAHTQETLKESVTPEDAWPMTSFNEKTGEITMEYGGHSVNLKRFTEGLKENPDDKPGKLMNLVQKGLRTEKLAGVNYELEDEKKFSEFVRKQAEDVVTEMNAKGGQKPIDLSNLTENEWLQLSFLIVQRNLEYDDVVLETHNASSRPENDKISAMPLDTMLMEYHKGVCRHYAASAEKVGEILKQLFPSKNLDNVSVEALPVDTLNHAYTAVLEQQADNLNIRFVDITGKKNAFRATDDLDAFKGKGLAYESAGDFLLSKGGEKLYSREVVIETFRNLVALNSDNPAARQFYIRELGDLFLQSSSTEEQEKGYQLYQKSIDVYRENYDQNFQRQQKGEENFIRLYPVLEPLQHLDTKFTNEKRWDELAELLFDNRLFSSQFTVVSPDQVSSFDRYDAMEVMIKHMKNDGEYEKILDIHSKYELPIYLQTYALEAQLETGRISEAMQFLVEKSADEDYEYPEGSFEEFGKILAMFQHKITGHPELMSHIPEADIQNFLSRLALNRANKGTIIRDKRDGKASLAPDETEGQMNKRWQDILQERSKLLVPLLQLGLTLDHGDGSTLAHFVGAFESEFQELLDSGACNANDLKKLQDEVRQKFSDLSSESQEVGSILEANLTYIKGKFSEFSQILNKKQ